MEKYSTFTHFHPLFLQIVDNFLSKSELRMWGLAGESGVLGQKRANMPILTALCKN